VRGMVRKRCYSLLFQALRAGGGIRYTKWVVLVKGADIPLVIEVQGQVPALLTLLTQFLILMMTN
jgi:hypothetical protein